MVTTDAVIDDLSAPHPRAANGAAWELIADRVMGGVSQGAMRREIVDGRPALRMQGTVSLENNGGFIQMALDLAPDGASIDAGHWSGIAIDARGNGQSYNVHLRTSDLTRPWQSYRQTVHPAADWQTLRLPFAAFEPHRIDAPLDLTALRRIGVVAIGRPFDVDIAVGGVRFYA